MSIACGGSSQRGSKANSCNEGLTHLGPLDVDASGANEHVVFLDDGLGRLVMVGKQHEREGLFLVHANVEHTPHILECLPHVPV